MEIGTKDWYHLTQGGHNPAFKCLLNSNYTDFPLIQPLLCTVLGCNIHFKKLFLSAKYTEGDNILDFLFSKLNCLKVTLKHGMPALANGYRQVCLLSFFMCF